MPTTSATAWSLDLAVRGGPRFVILTTDERHARKVLAAHLAQLDRHDAAMLVDRIDAEHVAVIW